MSSPSRAKASWRLFGLEGGMHGTWEEEERLGMLETIFTLGLPTLLSSSHLISPPATPWRLLCRMWGRRGFGHRPGDRTGIGGLLWGKQEDTTGAPAGSRTFVGKLDLARCLRLLHRSKATFKNGRKKLKLVEIPFKSIKYWAIDQMTEI